MLKGFLISIVYVLLISFVVPFFFGYYIGRFGGFFFSIFCVGISFFLSWLYFFFFFLFNSKVIILELGVWFKVETLIVAWNFLFDSLAIIMLLVVLTVSFLVHIFSYFYMYADPYSNRFMAFISLFTFFMVVLVLSTNFIMLFLGWEGVGLCSFLLISFWSSRVQAVKSAVKAMLINRVGDFFILAAIVLIFAVFRSVDFFVVFPQFGLYTHVDINFFNFSLKLVDVICSFLFLGAITKSSQIFFHGWLPDAMEGPTPVSALIHAATMVTAGVFLFIRASYLFEYSAFTLKLAVYFGAVTIVVFSLIGLCQNDIKKIIAYSTCSQLGYMILSCGLSGYNFALFHLFNHAFFKALLFLSAGSIIHFMNNEQDLRRLNGIFKLLPATSICVIVGSLSLAGFPFLSGFYSKDAILELLYYKYKDTNLLVVILAELGVLLTAGYSLKILYFLFFKENFNYVSNFKRFEVNFNLVDVRTFYNFSQYFPLFFLGIFSVFSGYFTKNLFLSLGENFFAFSILVLPNNQTADFEFIFHLVKLFPLGFLVLSVIIFYYFYYKVRIFFFNLPVLLQRIFLFFTKRNFFDSIYNIYLSNFFYFVSYRIFFILDKGFVESFGSFGLSRLIFRCYIIVFKSFASGKIDNYLFISFVSILVFFVFSCVLAS